MKTIKNKKTRITHNVDGENVSMMYVDLLKIGLNVMPQGGMTVEDMSKSIKLMDKLNETTKEDVEFKLEDDEFSYLYEKIPTKWNILHVDIVSFKDDMDNIFNK